MFNKHKHEEHEKHHGKKHEHHEKHHSRHGEHEKHHSGKHCAKKMAEGGYADKHSGHKCENMSEYADKMLKRFAEGGVAKVRHGQSTADGNQLNTKKVRNTGVYY